MKTDKTPDETPKPDPRIRITYSAEIAKRAEALVPYLQGQADSLGLGTTVTVREVMQAATSQGLKALEVASDPQVGS